MWNSASATAQLVARPARLALLVLALSAMVPISGGWAPASAGDDAGLRGSAADPIGELLEKPVRAKKDPAPDAAAKPAGPTLAQKIGQMIMVGFKGTDADAPEVQQLIGWLGEGKIGGVMLLGRNVSSPQQVKHLAQLIAAASPGRLPLIAVDQEGGKVQRLSARNGFSNFPSARDVVARGKPDDAEAGVYADMAETVASAGANVNFGPVVDLNSNPDNPVIGALGRSYSAKPKVVSGYATSFLKAHHRRGILVAAKHFPGHGSSDTDSHLGATDISASWTPAELEPFKALIDSGTDMIMVGHLIHPRFSDAKGIPATLSRKALTGELREKLGFDGVIITDDLQMGAIHDHWKLKQSVIKAVNAGNDILLYANYLNYDPAIGTKVHAIIVEAVLEGEIDESRIDEAFERIITMKGKLGFVKRSAMLEKARTAAN